MSLSENIIEAPAQQSSTNAEPLTYVYLCSSMHSGSTLLACLLQAHPDVSSVGEFDSSFDSRKLHCSCGSLTADCDYWNQWANEARKIGIDFEIGKLGIHLAADPNAPLISRVYYGQFAWHFLNVARNWLYPAWSEPVRQSAQAIDKSVRLAQLLCRMEATRVFFDSSKNPQQVRFLAPRPDIRVKMISLFRDGRGVINSLARHYKTPTEKAILDWVWSVRNQQRAARWLPTEDVLELRIEDLWDDPQGWTERLYAFCGVDTSFRANSFDPTSRHVIGNRMRLDFTGEIRPDYRWKNELGPDALAQFQRRAGKLNRALGARD